MALVEAPKRHDAKDNMGQEGEEMRDAEANLEAPPSPSPPSADGEAAAGGRGWS
jgi:hypothetical protein